METDEAIDALLVALDEYAKAWSSRMGLPIYLSFPRDVLRQIVRNWLCKTAGGKV